MSGFGLSGLAVHSITSVEFGEMNCFKASTPDGALVVSLRPRPWKLVAKPDLPQDVWA